MIIVNPSTRQFNIPGADLVFGVTADAGSVTKEFQCPRYVGNNLDLTGCFIRMNYRNANGEVDSYLVSDVTVDGDNVVFGWELTPKVTMYKGNVSFVMCVVGPDTKVKWHTTLGRGQVLEGLEPDNAIIEEGTADVVAQLIAMVEAQTEAVADEGAAQIKAVQTAAQTAQSDAVAQIEAKGVNTLATIPEDYTAVQSAVDGLVRGRAGAIVCSAEGSAVVVNDASDMAIQGLRIFGRSTQDGTPTPEAPVEIVSVENPVVTVAGKNLLPNAATNESYNGITITVNEDKSITVNGTATGYIFYAPYKFTFKAGQSYVLSGCPKNGSADTYFMYINNLGGVRDYGNGVVVNLDEDFTSDVGFSIRSGTTVNNLTFYPMVKVGAVIDEYEPRKPVQTVELTHTLPGIPVTSGGNYTDSDGQQWICDEVDLERGVYVHWFKSVSLTGEEDWVESATSLGQFSTSLGGGIISGGLCSHYPTRPSHTDMSVYTGYTAKIMINDSRFLGDVVGFKTWLAAQNTEGTPVVAVFRLHRDGDGGRESSLTETEIATYRALHSNYPNTTVLNDAGAHMVVKYAADTKLYIDNKIAALVGG